MAHSNCEGTWLGLGVEIMDLSADLTLRRRFCRLKGFSMMLALSEGEGGWAVVSS